MSSEDALAGVMLRGLVWRESESDDKGFFSTESLGMRQFFETYRDYPELSTMLRELPWSSNLHILSKTKMADEREFYLRMAIQHRWSVREVARR